MSGQDTLSEPKTRPGAIVQITYPVEVECRPVAGAVPSGGTVQWSTPATSGTVADIDANLNFCNYEPDWVGKFDGLKVGGIVEFGITFGVKTSQATANAKAKLEARNKGGTFVQIDDGGLYNGAFAITTTEVEKTIAGYYASRAEFNAVPFDLRIVFQSNNATALAIARVKNSSYVRGVIA